MCGRYGLWSRTERLAQLLGQTNSLPGGNLISNYNITPRTCSWVALIREAMGPAPVFESYEWGLLPGWAKEQAKLSRPINARADTVFDKPMFRGPIRRQRCLVPADGYYEWATTPQGKLPHWFTMASGEPFFFGGIWDFWHYGQPDALPTFALLTTEPNELCATVHDRMPVIVRAEDYALWLDPAVQDREALAHVLRPLPAELMRSHRVSKAVNNPRSNGQELILPVRD